MIGGRRKDTVGWSRTPSITCRGHSHPLNRSQGLIGLATEARELFIVNILKKIKVEYITIVSGLIF
jgi:hypothetical protein